MLFTYYLVADGPRLRRDHLQPAATRSATRRCWRPGSWRSPRPAATSTRGRCWRWCRRSSTGSCSRRPASRRRSRSRSGSGSSASSCRSSAPTSPGCCRWLIAFLDSPVKAAVVLGFIIVYQQLENYFFAPRITARTMELHPAVAFGAALAGIELLGVGGSDPGVAGGGDAAGDRRRVGRTPRGDRERAHGADRARRATLRSGILTRCDDEVRIGSASCRSPSRRDRASTRACTSVPPSSSTMTGAIVWSIGDPTRRWCIRGRRASRCRPTPCWAAASTLDAGAAGAGVRQPRRHAAPRATSCAARWRPPVSTSRRSTTRPTSRSTPPPPRRILADGGQRVGDHDELLGQARRDARHVCRQRLVDRRLPRRRSIRCSWRSPTASPSWPVRSCTSVSTDVARRPTSSRLDGLARAFGELARRRGDVWSAMTEPSRARRRRASRCDPADARRARADGQGRCRGGVRGGAARRSCGRRQDRRRRLAGGRCGAGGRAVARPVSTSTRRSSANRSVVTANRSASVRPAVRRTRVTSPVFRTLDDVVYGRVDQVSPLIRRVIAENPSKFTYRGTGTYIVGHGDVVVIDPGSAPRLASRGVGGGAGAASACGRSSSPTATPITRRWPAGCTTRPAHRRSRSVRTRRPIRHGRQLATTDAGSESEPEPRRPARAGRDGGVDRLRVRADRRSGRR